MIFTLLSVMIHALEPLQVYEVSQSEITISQQTESSTHTTSEIERGTLFVFSPDFVKLILPADITIISSYEQNLQTINLETLRLHSCGSLSPPLFS